MRKTKHDTTLDFYDDLAEHYHLLFDDWGQVIKRQAGVLNKLLSSLLPTSSSLKILDSACGIGTQAIGLAMAGHRVVGSDLSLAAVSRARLETKRRGLDVAYFVSNATSLEEIIESDFDIIASLDNALTHLTPEELLRSFQTARAKIRPGGLFVASVRDYDQENLQRTAVRGPEFYGPLGNRRIVHQVWDWVDDENYLLHLYITIEETDRWTCRHFASNCRRIKRQALSEYLQTAGFNNIRWLMPKESGFYQPIVVGTKHS